MRKTVIWAVIVLMVLMVASTVTAQDVEGCELNAPAGVNFRAEPSTQHDPVDRPSGETTIYAFERDGEWLHMMYRGRYAVFFAWVRSDLVTQVGSDEACDQLPENNTSVRLRLVYLPTVDIGYRMVTGLAPVECERDNACRLGMEYDQAALAGLNVENLVGNPVCQGQQPEVTVMFANGFTEGYFDQENPVCGDDVEPTEEAVVIENLESVEGVEFYSVTEEVVAELDNMYCGDYAVYDPQEFMSVFELNAFCFDQETGQGYTDRSTDISTRVQFSTSSDYSLIFLDTSLTDSYENAFQAAEDHFISGLGTGQIVEANIEEIVYCYYYPAIAGMPFRSSPSLYCATESAVIALVGEHADNALAQVKAITEVRDYEGGIAGDDFWVDFQSR
jgi:hypothetical protein